MTSEVQSPVSTVDHTAASVVVRLRRRPTRISESGLSQPAWTTIRKRTEQKLIVRSGKSEAEVANNRRLHSAYCIIETNSDTKH